MTTLWEDFLGGIWVYSALACIFGVLLGMALPAESRASKALFFVVFVGLLSVPALLAVDADEWKGFESLASLQWLAVLMPAFVLYLGLPSLLGFVIGRRLARQSARPVKDPLDNQATRFGSDG